MIGVALALAVSAAAQSAPSAPADSAEFDALVSRLGDDDYVVRERALRELLARGREVVPALRQRLAIERDPEIVRRIELAIDFVEPPTAAALVIRAASGAPLRPGDVITHVGNRRVSSVAELRRRLVELPYGAAARIIGRDGPQEVGPIEASDLTTVVDYKAQHGETIARLVREYDGGYVERAADLLATLPAGLDEAQLSRPLRSMILYCAGRGADGLALLKDSAGGVRPPNGVGNWSSPSVFELLTPRTAPYQLEWELFSTGDPPLYEDRNDPDLRVQRILAPAGRYADAFVRSVELWKQRYRDKLGREEDTNRVAGNQLAVCGWMLSELGLMSECCRLIEPRSRILRQSPFGSRKWLRVETDAWLPFLRGDAQAALDLLYDDGLDVLRMPPDPEDNDALVRNPLVAARLGFFVYQVEAAAQQAEEAIKAVSQYGHPFLREYLDWMLFSLTPANAALIRSHAQLVLQQLPAADAALAGWRLLLLEYVQADPDLAVMNAARQRMMEAPVGTPARDCLPLADALIALVEDRPAQAAAALGASVDGLPGANLLRTTVQFRQTVARGDDARREPPAGVRLAKPVASDGSFWLILSRERVLYRYDAAAGALLRLDPGPTWYPGPLTWPWLGGEPASGRAWLYDRCRLLEIVGERTVARLNLRPELVGEFDGHASAVYSDLVWPDVPPAAPDVSGAEPAAFLRADLQANREFVADPDLPEVSAVRPVDAHAGVWQVTLRGGRQILIDEAAGRTWSSGDVGASLGLASEPTFVAIVPPLGTSDAARPLLLLSDQGLIRIDAGRQGVERLALPGDAPFPPLVPESAPYDRRDPRYAYFAVHPAQGGAVFRYIVADGRVEALDLRNLALTREYQAGVSRAQVRAELDARLGLLGYDGLSGFLDDTQRVVDEWYSGLGKLP